MLRLPLAAALLLSAFTVGCGTDSCPAGSTMVGERCIASDGGTDLDADMSVHSDMMLSDDMQANPDATLTCSPACSGNTPYCVGGICTECVETSDCPDRSPLCVANACRPCSDGTCDGAQALRELSARSCEQVTRFLGTSTYVSFRAQICAGTAFTTWSYYASRLAAMDSGRIRFLASEFESCAALPLSLEESCPNFAGQVLAGEDCYDNSECASGTCSGATCPGHCDAEVAEHGACNGNAACMDGFSCIGLSCEAGGHIGDPCVGGSCAEGNCNTETDRCVPFLVAGDACDYPGSYCTTNLLCDPTNSHCRDFHGIGEECDPTYFGPTCADGSVCVSNMCVRAHAEGEACTPGPSSACDVGTTCTEGHCERIRSNHEACGPAPCATGLRCAEGRCEPLPDLGASCTVDSGCLRGTCTGGTCMSLPATSSCIVTEIQASDAMDACGTGSTCVAQGAEAPECIADANLSEACGSAVAQCAAPNECVHSACAMPCLAPASP